MPALFYASASIQITTHNFTLHCDFRFLVVVHENLKIISCFAIMSLNLLFNSRNNPIWQAVPYVNHPVSKKILAQILFKMSFK